MSYIVHKVESADISLLNKFNTANFSSTLRADHFSSGCTPDEVICLALGAIQYEKYVSLNTKIILNISLLEFMLVTHECDTNPLECLKKHRSNPIISVLKNPQRHFSPIANQKAHFFSLAPKTVHDLALTYSSNPGSIPEWNTCHSPHMLCTFQSPPTLSLFPGPHPGILSLHSASLRGSPFSQISRSSFVLLLWQLSIQNSHFCLCFMRLQTRYGQGQCLSLMYIFIFFQHHLHLQAHSFQQVLMNK